MERTVADLDTDKCDGRVRTYIVRRVTRHGGIGHDQCATVRALSEVDAVNKVRVEFHVPGMLAPFEVECLETGLKTELI